MHVAAKPGVMWVRREAMHRFFAYPFLQLGCNRVTGLVAATNLTARKFDEHIGFVQEGVLREGLPNGEALIVYGMLRAECRWINR
jgi:RimJ/RimL family protein N-acetyltransferase